MKFLEFLVSSQIQIWKDFYINYNLLKQILKPLHVLYKAKLRSLYLKKSNIDESREALLLSLNEPDVNIPKISKEFQTQVLLELQKVLFFYTETLHKKIEPRLFEIQEQIDFAKAKNCFYRFQKTFELSIKELYKEITLLKDFLDLNIKALGKISKKYKKMIKLISKENKLSSQEFFIDSKINNFIEKSELNEYENTFNKLFNQIGKIFAFGFADKYKNKTNKILKYYNAKSQFTKFQTFKLGIMISIIAFEIIIIICICYNYQISMNSDLNFSTIVPSYRAFFLILVYLFFLGINYYIWNSKNLAYKILLKTPSGNFDTYGLIYRSATFGLLLFTCFLLYLFTREQIVFLHYTFTLIPSHFYPLIVWGCFFLYLLCPFPEILDYEPRCYIFNLIKESIQLHIEFLHVWCVEQFISFIGIFRGLEYTICYYAYFHQSEKSVDDYCSYKHSHFKFFVIALLPNLFRLIQCLLYLFKYISNRYIFISQIMNLVKNLLIIFTCFMSYLSMHFYFKRIFFKIWIILVVTGSIFSSFYDLKYDFGLLQIGKYFPLRTKLYYPKNCYYYCIIANFFLRICFFLLISPEILAIFISTRLQSTLFALYLCEIIRRFIWNCFRIEVKHIEAAKRYQTSNEVKLPFQYSEKEGFSLKKEFCKNNETNCQELLYLVNDNPQKSFTSESIQFESKSIGDIEEKIMFDMETFYEKSLGNYLTKKYYQSTKDNLGENNPILMKLYIIDNEYIN